jgi:hypothetical protein
MTTCLYPSCNQDKATALGLCRHHAFAPEYRSFRDELRKGRQSPSEPQATSGPPEPLREAPGATQALETASPVRGLSSSGLATNVELLPDEGYCQETMRQILEGFDDVKVGMSAVNTPKDTIDVHTEKLVEKERELARKLTEDLFNEVCEGKAEPLNDLHQSMISEGCPNTQDQPVAITATLVKLDGRPNANGDVFPPQADIKVVNAGGGPNRGGDAFDKIMVAPSNYPLMDPEGNIVGWSRQGGFVPRTPMQKLFDNIFDPLDAALKENSFQVIRTGDFVTLEDSRTNHLIWDGKLQNDMSVLFDLVRASLGLPKSWPTEKRRFDRHFGHATGRNMAVELRAVAKQLTNMADTMCEVSEHKMDNGVSRIYKAYGMKRSPLDARGDKDAPPDLPPGTQYTLLPAFRRYIRCPVCFLMAPVWRICNSPVFNLRWKDFEFHADCVTCEHTGKFDVIDMPQKDKPPFIKVWKPGELTAVGDDFTDEQYYFWSIPDDLKKKLYEGPSFYLEHTPLWVFDALRRCDGEPIRLPAGAVKTA